MPSLKNWNNGETVLRPVDVAREFAASWLFGDLQSLAYQCLDLYESGRAREAKDKAEEAPRSEFGTSREYLLWAQFNALWSKSDLEGDMDSRRIDALRKFEASEMACKRANKRLRYFWSQPDRENPLYRVILSRARNLISKTLGNFSENTLEQIISWSRPGGGTAIGSRDPQRVQGPWKLGPSTRLCVTEAALPYAKMLVESSWPWARLHATIDWSARTYSVPYETTGSNRIAFVRKDATTLRTIAVEPHLNQCLQLGAGEYIARRLRAHGIDLSDQSRNQRYAREGAANWQDLDPYVTLDLSAASDSISLGLVERLLPPTWVDFLGCLRSPSYTLDGQSPKEFQKWSSMGNGYTFPLETLIFWAIGVSCYSMVESHGSTVVYGDDIIVRRSTAALLTEVLKYCGFKVNTAKSFYFGPFRESCGEDWWEMDRVVPLYLRWIARLRPTDIYRCHNGLKQLGLLSGDISSCLLRAHKGVPLVRVPPNSDLSSGLFSDRETLLRGGYFRRSRDWQCQTYLRTTFRPYKLKCGELAGLAWSLFGSRELTDDRWAKSTLRRRGQWSLLRVAAD